MILALALGFAQAATQDPGTLEKAIRLMNPVSKTSSSFLLDLFASPRDNPKLSPKGFGDPPKQGVFPWLVKGFGLSGGYAVERTRVYCQQQADENTAIAVGRMQMRLWEYLSNTLGMDHPDDFYHGVLFTYLCQGGKPGGEEIAGNDLQVDGDRVETFAVNEQGMPLARRAVGGGGEIGKALTVYIYDIGTFSKPMEMAREVAHEYGHAALPGVGGYSEPEYWANGYLGEKLFLKHAAEAMTRGDLIPDDVMGVTLPQIKSWLKTNVDPLVEDAAVHGPFDPRLRDTSTVGMGYYIGLALYMDTVLPEKVFSRSMQVMGSIDAKDYPDAIVLAATEPAKYTLRVPAYLSGKTIWFPLASSKLFGAAVLKKKGDWALIRPGTGPVTVVPRHDPGQS
ncbi:MAG TPA: hypothetical protein VG944_19660 [Fimbriimonas sp.]|nr:hypothetical protein [Fimbriimonas sp.]